MNLIGPELADPFAAPYRLRPDRFYRHALDVVTPYPDLLAYATLTDDYLAQHPRDGLVVFAGYVHAGRDPAHWRRRMRDLFVARNDPRVVWHEMGDLWELSTDIYAAMARAEFGVVLEGDSITSRRLFTLDQAGTIPVLLVDDLVLPFESRLDWDAIALSVPIRRVFNDPSFDFIRYLEDVPIAQRERMRAAGRAARHALTFHEGRIEPGDAVDLIVRISSSLWRFADDSAGRADGHRQPRLAQCRQHAPSHRPLRRLGPVQDRLALAYGRRPALAQRSRPAEPLCHLRQAMCPLGRPLDASVHPTLRSESVNGRSAREGSTPAAPRCRSRRLVC